MFCPKCGQQNPENGKFCRACGTDLGNLSEALTMTATAKQRLTDRRGRPISLESAITKIFSGIAFLIVAGILGYTNIAAGRVWWFWMLIPAFGALGTGIAQMIQVRRLEGRKTVLPPADPALTGPLVGSLPSPQTQWAQPDSAYRTGDLVPPSVTDNTTRHLEMDSEGRTMTLPKK